MNKQELQSYKINLYHRVAGLREQVNKLDPSATGAVNLELVQVEALVEWLGDYIKEQPSYER